MLSLYQQIYDYKRENQQNTKEVPKSKKIIHGQYRLKK